GCAILPRRGASTSRSTRRSSRRRMPTSASGRSTTSAGSPLPSCSGSAPGSFEPLASLPDDKRVVLGLVSTKWAEIENGDLLAGRIEEAAGYHPKERL